jgi:hypothetical protein
LDSRIYLLLIKEERESLFPVYIRGFQNTLQVSKIDDF